MALNQGCNAGVGQSSQIVIHMTQDHQDLFVLKDCWLLFLGRHGMRAGEKLQLGLCRQRETKAPQRAQPIIHSLPQQFEQCSKDKQASLIH